MLNILNNPWIVGIGTGIIVGLILKLLLKKQKEPIEDKSNLSSKRIGVINRGKNTEFHDNDFEGLDIGIQEEGENTIIEENRFK